MYVYTCMYMYMYMYIIMYTHPVYECTSIYIHMYMSMYMYTPCLACTCTYPVCAYSSIHHAFTCTCTRKYMYTYGTCI